MTKTSAHATLAIALATPNLTSELLIVLLSSFRLNSRVSDYPVFVAVELPPEIAARLLPPATKKRTDEKGLVEQLRFVPDDLSATEHTVFKLLSTDDPAHIDALAEASKLSVPELTEALLALEMRELIRQLPGRCFVKKL